MGSDKEEGESMGEGEGGVGKEVEEEGEGGRVWQRGGGGVMEGVGKMRRKREGRGDTEEG